MQAKLIIGLLLICCLAACQQSGADKAETETKAVTEEAATKVETTTEETTTTTTESVTTGDSATEAEDGAEEVNSPTTEAGDTKTEAAAKVVAPAASALGKKALPVTASPNTGITKQPLNTSGGIKPSSSGGLKLRTRPGGANKSLHGLKKSINK